MDRAVRKTTAALLVLLALALPALVGAVEVGQAAPDFTLPTITGGAPLALASLKGKVVVVDFWASWCQPCIKALPELDELQRELGAKGLVVLAVSIDEELDLAKRALGTTKRSFTALHDGGAVVSESFGVGDALPATVVIDRQGRVKLFRSGGAVDAAQLRRAVEALL